MSAPRVRFAPSPTGFLHIGGARTALFNWLFARRNGGTFVLRIEDTDRERSTESSVQAILQGLSWLEIDWDEGPGKGGDFGPYFQTERLGIYKEWADKLVSAGKAYRCYCSSEELDAQRKGVLGFKYPGTCRERKDQPDKPWVLRFKMPVGDGTVHFKDLILGNIAKPYSDLDDWVMMRGDGVPLYNFGCVIDDYLMKISHVGRGQEHVNSTLPQLMLYDALGWERPQFAHFPLILGPDREKLSKRKHPEADVLNHKNAGVLPEALLNYVIRLGWSHGDDEVISRAQMKEWFDLADVGSSSGVWDPTKLAWLNQHYLKTLPPEEIARRVQPYFADAGFDAALDDRLKKLVGLLAPRAQSLKEMVEKSRWVYAKGVEVDAAAAAKHLSADSKPALKAAREKLAALGGWQAAEIDAVVKVVSEELKIGMGKVAQPMRVAVTGNTTSPGIGDTLELVGRDESLARIDAALGR
jgi:glutamyl-tRNA synthetase